MRITSVFLITIVLMLVGMACAEFSLPDDEEVREIFTSTQNKPSLEPRAPDNVPILALTEREDWHNLCDECHHGPNYSSKTILTWGHKHECVKDLACNQCHDDKLHETNLRGNKSTCFDCHMSRSLPLVCDTCHTPGCRGENVSHSAEFRENHGSYQDWEGINCFICHGSQSWCKNCHGVDMPHPDNILITHPDLVQGDPQRCTTCHGLLSCTNCHNQRGVTVSPSLPGL